MTSTLTKTRNPSDHISLLSEGTKDRNVTTKVTEVKVLVFFVLVCEDVKTREHEHVKDVGDDPVKDVGDGDGDDPDPAEKDSNE